ARSPGAALSLVRHNQPARRSQSDPLPGGPRRQRAGVRRGDASGRAGPPGLGGGLTDLQARSLVGAAAGLRQRPHGAAAGLSRHGRPVPPHGVPPRMIPCLLTFDIEDWFQVENLRPLFPPERWETIPRRVAEATRRVLKLLAEHRIRSTFFVLGWVAEREPELVREIASGGRAIACHGYGHG